MGLIENWLSIVIEFYQVLNQVVTENTNALLSSDIKEIKENLNDVVSQIDKIKIEVSSLYSSQKLIKWLNKNLKNESIEIILNEIDESENDSLENTELLNIIKVNLQTNKENSIKNDRLEVKMNDSEISVKHKLKLSIPVFLFTRYEQEIELGNKQKLPTSLKELKSLLLK